MWQSVYQNTGTFERSQYRPGAIRNLPGLWCPGPMRDPLEVYFAADGIYNGTYDDPQKIRHLMIAIFARACRDATIPGQDRQEAIGWLQINGAIWAQGLGLRIRQADITRWIKDGCPNPRRRQR
jgi:hypothetical protein